MSDKQTILDSDQPAWKRNRTSNKSNSSDQHPPSDELAETLSEIDGVSTRAAKNLASHYFDLEDIINHRDEHILDTKYVGGATLNALKTAWEDQTMDDIPIPAGKVPPQFELESNNLSGDDIYQDRIIKFVANDIFPSLENNPHPKPVTGWSVTVTRDDKRFDWKTLASPLNGDAKWREYTLVLTSDKGEAFHNALEFMRLIAKTPNGWTLTINNSLEKHRWLSWDHETELALWQHDRNNLEQREFYLTKRSDPLKRRPHQGSRKTVGGEHLSLSEAYDRAIDTLEEIDGYPKPTSEALRSFEINPSEWDCQEESSENSNGDSEGAKSNDDDGDEYAGSETAGDQERRLSEQPPTDQPIENVGTDLLSPRERAILDEQDVHISSAGRYYADERDSTSPEDEAETAGLDPESLFNPDKEPQSDRRIYTADNLQAVSKTDGKVDR